MKISRLQIHPHHTVLFGAIVGVWAQLILPGTPVLQSTFWIIHICVLITVWILLLLNLLIYLSHVHHARYFWDYDLEWLLLHSIPWIILAGSVFLYPVFRTLLPVDVLAFGDTLYLGAAFGLLHWMYQLKSGVDSLSINSRLQRIVSLKAIDYLWKRLHRAHLRSSEHLSLITVWEIGMKKALVQQDVPKVTMYYQTVQDCMSEHTLSKEALTLLVSHIRILYTYQYCLPQRQVLISLVRKASYQSFPHTKAWDIWSMWYHQLSTPQKVSLMHDFWTDISFDSLSFQNYPSSWKFDAIQYSEAKPLLAALGQNFHQGTLSHSEVTGILQYTSGTVALQYLSETFLWITSNKDFQGWLNAYLNQESIDTHPEPIIYQAAVRDAQMYQTLNFITQWIQDTRPDASMSTSQVELTLVWLNSLLPEYHKDTHQRQIIHRWIHIWQGIGERLRR